MLLLLSALSLAAAPLKLHYATVFAADPLALPGGDVVWLQAGKDSKVGVVRLGTDGSARWTSPVSFPKARYDWGVGPFVGEKRTTSTASSELAVGLSLGPDLEGLPGGEMQVMLDTGAAIHLVSSMISELVVHRIDAASGAATVVPVGTGPIPGGTWNVLATPFRADFVAVAIADDGRSGVAHWVNEDLTPGPKVTLALDLAPTLAPPEPGAAAGEVGPLAPGGLGVKLARLGADGALWLVRGVDTRTVNVERVTRDGISSVLPVTAAIADLQALDMTFGRNGRAWLSLREGAEERLDAFEVLGLDFAEAPPSGKKRKGTDGPALLVGARVSLAADRWEGLDTPARDRQVLMNLVGTSAGLVMVTQDRALREVTRQTSGGRFIHTTEVEGKDGHAFLIRADGSVGWHARLPTRQKGTASLAGLADGYRVWEAGERLGLAYRDDSTGFRVVARSLDLATGAVGDASTLLDVSRGYFFALRQITLLNGGRVFAPRFKGLWMTKTFDLTFPEAP